MNSPVSTPSRPSTGGLVLLTLLAALAVKSLWRIALAYDITSQAAADHQLAASAPVFWQNLDPLLGWLALLILALANRLTRPHERKTNAADSVFLFLGITSAFIIAAFPDAPWRTFADFLTAILLALAALISVAREFRAITNGLFGAASHGINIEQLWRLVTSQWILLWISIEIFALFKGSLANTSARTLLFLIPAAGVLPNVLMAVGIRWWADLLGRPRSIRPRQRAWLLALTLHNIGATLLFMKPGALGALGTLLILAAAVIYLAGFPAKSHPCYFLFVLAAAYAALGWILLGIERIQQSNDQSVLLHFTAAWRTALSDGWLPLWLLASGATALRTRLVPPLQMPILIVLSWLLLASGGLLLTVAWLLTAADRGLVGWLILGAAVESAGILIASLATLRAASLIQRTGSRPD